jgi:hypothetical protein
VSDDAAVQHAPGADEAVFVIDGFGRLTVPLADVTMVDGRVLVDLADAALAAELDKAGIRVNHLWPDPTAVQIAAAVRDIPPAALDSAMARILASSGMDCTPGQVALQAMAELLEERGA